jgi:hypothetical protein
VNVASINTVTVYGVQQTTQTYVQPPPTTATVAVYNQPTTQVAAGFCQTLTMTGPDLPRVTQGACGTILIVNEGAQNIRILGYGIGMIVFLVHLAVGRVFHWI